MHEVKGRSSTTGQPLAEIHVCANNSLSPGSACLFMAVTALATFTLSGLLAANGYWPVLPFAGLELFLLGLALGMSMRRGRRREVISIDADRVCVTKEVPGREPVHRELARHWARVEQRPAARRGHPGRLLIVSHGRSVEVGSILTEEERRSLGCRLAELIGATGQTPGKEPRERAGETS